MITHAKEEWVPDLKRLWTDVYGDGEEQVDAFFRSFFREDLAWCAVEAGRPVSAIYGILAGVWTEGGGSRPLLYLYAGATDPGRRGRGHYGRLLRGICAEQETAAPAGRLPALSPVPELIPYYERLGFHLITRRTTDVNEAVPGWSAGSGEAGEAGKTAVLSSESVKGREFLRRRKPLQGQIPLAGREPLQGLTPLQGREPLQGQIPLQGRESLQGLTPLRLRPTSAEEYKAFRDKKLGRPGYVEWGEPFLRYAIRGAVGSGGAAGLMLVDGEEQLLLAQRAADRLLILETTLSRKQLRGAAPQLLTHFGCAGLAVRNPPLMSAVSRWPGEPYFAIALDE